jgi:DNA-binding LacI/PurR family transcriptional regulator
MIGVLVSELNSIFAIDVVARIERIFKSKGYGTIVSDCGLDKNEERKTVNYLLRRGIDGIVAMPHTATGAEYSSAAERGIPIVFWDNMAATDTGDTVATDNYQSAYNATEYLAERGHREIGIIAGGEQNYPSTERLKGYRQALTDAGIAVNEGYIRICPFDIPAAKEDARSFLLGQKSLTAVISGGYQFSVGLIMALNELKINVPDDLSVIIYDDVLINGLYPKRLAHVSQSADTIAHRVVELMTDRLTGVENGAQTKVATVESQFFEGESVRRI